MSDQIPDIANLLKLCVDLDHEKAWQEHQGQALRGKKGQIIFHAQDPSDAVYLLVEGEARCWVGNSDNKQVTLLLRAPAFFGDRDLLANVEAHETVQLVTPGRILMWGRKGFSAAWRESKALRERVTRDLAVRYVRSLAFRELALEPMHARLMFVLHDRLQRGITSMPNTKYLAYLLSTGEKSTARALTELKKSSTLVVENDRFILDVSRSELAEDIREVFHSLSSVSGSR